KLFDQPRTGDSIDVHSLARNPLHDQHPFALEMVTDSPFAPTQLFGAPAAIHGSSTFSMKSAGKGLATTGTPVSPSIGIRFSSCAAPNRPFNLSKRKLA